MKETGLSCFELFESLHNVDQSFDSQMNTMSFAILQHEQCILSNTTASHVSKTNIIADTVVHCPCDA
ncbi:hypothetical protein D3C80_2010730 [compost metagenome]